VAHSTRVFHRGPQWAFSPQSWADRTEPNFERTRRSPALQINISYFRHFSSFSIHSTSNTTGGQKSRPNLELFHPL